MSFDQEDKELAKVSCGAFSCIVPCILAALGFILGIAAIIRGVIH